MYKVAWIARFQPDIDRDDARRHWEEVHGPLCTQVPGLERYEQNHVVAPLPQISGVPQTETFFDGYSCGTWADEAAYRAAMASREWQALRADGQGLFDRAWLEGMSAHVEEHPMIEGARGPFKVVWIVKFTQGMDRAAASLHWRTTHGSLFKRIDVIDRYVQNHVVAPLGGDGEAREALRFDGFSEAWFQDEQKYLEALAHPAWADAITDGYNVFVMNEMLGAVLQETVIKDDGAGRISS